MAKEDQRDRTAKTRSNTRAASATYLGAEGATRTAEYVNAAPIYMCAMTSAVTFSHPSGGDPRYKVIDRLLRKPLTKYAR